MPLRRFSLRRHSLRENRLLYTGRVCSGIFLFLFMVSPACWAKDSFVTDGLFGPVSRQPLSSPAFLSGSPSLLRRFQGALSIQTVLIREPMGTTHLKDFLSEKEDNRTVSIRMSTSFWSGRISGEGEIAERSASDLSALQDASALRRRLLRFGLTGLFDRFRYGATYRVAGEAFTALQDQAVREVWGEWSLGVARFKTAMTERWNNITKDPRRPRITGMQESASLVIAPISWPEVSLSYARDSSSSALEPTGVLPQRSLSDTLEAALLYKRPRWEARFLSSYSLNSDRLRPNEKTIGLTYAISGLYRPTDTLTIVPSLSLHEDQRRLSGVQIETPSASVTFTYSPSAAFRLTVFGSYSKTQSSDGLVDYNLYRMASALTWTCHETTKLRTILSFNASYTSSLDVVQVSRSTEDISGLLRVQVAGL